MYPYSSIPSNAKETSLVYFAMNFSYCTKNMFPFNLPPPPHTHRHTRRHTQDSHFSCWVKNVYLLTGRERAATMCPIRLANGSIHHRGARLSSSSPAPVPGQIEHDILCSHLISPSHPVTEDSPLLQWRASEREEGREGESGHTFLHTHPRAHARSRQWNWQRKPHTLISKLGHTYTHTHTRPLPHTHTLADLCACHHKAATDLQIQQSINQFATAF